MNLEQIMPAIFLIAVLILVFPSFLISNLKMKQFLKNLSIWTILIIFILIIYNFSK